MKIVNGEEVGAQSFEQKVDHYQVVTRKKLQRFKETGRKVITKVKNCHATYALSTVNTV